MHEPQRQFKESKKLIREMSAPRQEYVFVGPQATHKQDSVATSDCKWEIEGTTVQTLSQGVSKLRNPTPRHAATTNQTTKLKCNYVFVSIYAASSCRQKIKSATYGYFFICICMSQLRLTDIELFIKLKHNSTWQIIDPYSSL